MTTETQASGFPLDNLTYDLMTIIQEKSQALQAYDTYGRDAEGDAAVSALLQQIREQDEHMISQLVQHLARRLGGTSSASTDSTPQADETTLSDDETLTGRVLGDETPASDLDAASGTPA